MEALAQQLERFSEVLAVSGSAHVRAWAPSTVSRALQWARYLRHVHRRFGDHGRVRDALERRLRAPGGALPLPASALRGFRALERCDERLALRLLRNRALGPAAAHALLRLLFPGPGADPDPDPDGGPRERLTLLARRACALSLLRAGGDAHARGDAPADPLRRTHARLLLRRLRELSERAEPWAARRLLGRLWERGPRPRLLAVATEALLLAAADPADPEPGATPELLAWLLDAPERTAALCRLPAELIGAAAGRHPELSRAYLDRLLAWARRLRYDLPEGAWVSEDRGHGPWDELRFRFRCLCRGPEPLRDHVLAALRACEAQEGGFPVPGLCVWTDLLALLGRE